MSTVSVLFEAEPPAELPKQQPACFPDLNLDQVVERLVDGLEDFELHEFLWSPLGSVEAIIYRHEVFHDLDRSAVLGAIERFCKAMQQMRDGAQQATTLRHPLQRERWHADSALSYIQGVQHLANDLKSGDVRSRALTKVSKVLDSYVASTPFQELESAAQRVTALLADVTFCVDTIGNRVTVRRYDQEPDYSAAIETTFERFRQGAVQDHRVRFTRWPDMNHVEEQVIERVARLFPDTFATMHRFSVEHPVFVDQTVARFDREIQFYLTYQQLRRLLADAGLATSYPRMSKRAKHLLARDTYDLALAGKLLDDRSPVITNDIELAGAERILIVSGPNQGGKTTLARTFGQLHYLARLGVPLPGASTQILLCDEVFTHFEREESHQDLSGKLEDDLLRIHDVLEAATPRSVIVLNEIFTSTTLDDAIAIGCRVLEEIVRLDALCVCVSFVDEFVNISDTTVSMVSTIVPNDPTRRTFKLERKPPDGTAHALALARKYGLTYEELKARLAS